MNPVFRSILVPLDGSCLAEQALPLAATIAEQHQASVTLAIVHPWGKPEDAPRPASRADEELRVAEGRYLNRLRQTLAAAYRLTVREVLLDGPATGSTLVKYARRRQVDLIVACTHDYGVLGRFLSGGVARRVAHHSSSGVLFVKPQVQPLSIHPTGFSRVLVALDGSFVAETALEPTIALTSREAEITLLSVIPGKEPAPQLAAEVREYLENVRRQAQRSGRQFVLAVLGGSNVAATIARYVERNGVELIALTTRPRRPLTRAVFGSTADAVLHRAKVPVLVCHALVKPQGLVTDHPTYELAEPGIWRA